MTVGFRYREKDPEDVDIYERVLVKLRARVDRARTGKIVMRRAAMPTEQNRQGLIRWFMNAQEDPGDTTAESALQDWDVFTHEVRTQSGAHRHQGGLVIYVVKGSGYTVVEGRKVEWKAGDLLLLPVVPGGVAHQHFNAGDDPAEWVAFIYRPMHHAVGSYVEQISEAPAYHV